MSRKKIPVPSEPPGAKKLFQAAGAMLADLHVMLDFRSADFIQQLMWLAMADLEVREVFLRYAKAHDHEDAEELERMYHRRYLKKVCLGGDRNQVHLSWAEDTNRK